MSILWQLMIFLMSMTTARGCTCYVASYLSVYGLVYRNRRENRREKCAAFRKDFCANYKDKRGFLLLGKIAGVAHKRNFAFYSVQVLQKFTIPKVMKISRDNALHMSSHSPNGRNCGTEFSVGKTYLIRGYIRQGHAWSDLCQYSLKWSTQCSKSAMHTYLLKKGCQNQKVKFPCIDIFRSLNL